MAVFILAIVLSITLGVLAHRRSWSVFGGPAAWGTAAAQRFGRASGAILILFTGWVSVALVGLGLGFLAKAIENSVDEPIFHWIFRRTATDTGNFSILNNKLTLMGNNPIVQLVAGVSVIIFVCIYKRRWWIPVIAVGAAYFGEHYLQTFLAKIVGRGHPPTTLGTWPSGGVGRILGVYSVVVILVIMLMPTLTKAWQAGLWTGLITAANIEAYTRIYLSKHWFTDAAFALIFGLLLLLTNIAFVSALSREVTDQTPCERRRSMHPEGTASSA